MKEYSDIFVGVKELKSIGLISSQQEIYGVGASVYGDPLDIVSIDDVVADRFGVFVPCIGRWVLETTLAGQLRHRSDVAALLRSAGQTPSRSPEEPRGEISEDIVWARMPWDVNYQHFFIETLPRIFLAHDRLRRRTPVSYLVQDTAFIADLIACLGIRLASVLRSSTGADATPMRLKRVFISPIVNSNMLPLRNKALALAAAAITASPRADLVAPERIYIGRRPDPRNNGATRLLINELALSQALMRHGYATVFMEDHDISGKIALLAQAREVVILVGAGIVNLAFAPRLERVLFIAHPNMNLPTAWFGALLQHFAAPAWAEVVGHVPPDAPTVTNPAHAPYVVGVGAVEAALNRMRS